MAQNQTKTQVMYRVPNRARRTEACTTLMPEGQLWPFLRMRNSKLGKNSWSELGEDGDGPFAKTSHRKENESCKTLLIKWLSNVRRNDFVVNNSLMSIDRPKPANSNTRKFMRKCYKQSCAFKTANINVKYEVDKNGYRRLYMRHFTPILL